MSFSIRVFQYWLVVVNLTDLDTQFTMPKAEMYSILCVICLLKLLPIKISCIYFQLLKLNSMNPSYTITLLSINKHIK